MLVACLQGVRVLGLGQYIPGPFAAQFPAGPGAEAKTAFREGGVSCPAP